MSFQADPTSDLFEPAQRAASDWSTALGRSVTVTEDGEIPIFRVNGDCDPTPEGSPSGAYVGACSRNLQGPDARIEVSARTPKEELYVTLKHEMGHQLSGSREHVEDDPDAVMYYYKPKGSPFEITKSDVLYVCRGFDCDPKILEGLT